MAGDSSKLEQRFPHGIKQHAEVLFRDMEVEAARAHFRSNEEGISRARAEFEELCAATEAMVTELGSRSPLRYVRRDPTTFVLVGPHCCATAAFGASPYSDEAVEPRAVTVITWRGETPPPERRGEIARIMLLPDVYSGGPRAPVAWHCRFPEVAEDNCWATTKVSEFLLHWFMDQIEQRFAELTAAYRARVDPH